MDVRQAPLSLASVMADIGDVLGDSGAVDASGGDLIASGLDSLHVMRLAGRWRARGVEVRFAELMERPTLAQWWELLAERQGANGGTPGPAPAPAAVDQVDDDAPFDLATMQYAYWVGRDEHLVLGGVATHFYAEFDGSGVDPARLDAAVRALIRRHGMLRVRFLDDGRQQIMPDSPWSGPTVYDLRGVDPAAVERDLAEVRDRLSHRRFDVAAGEVFDVGLSLLPGGATRTHVNIDMLVADALSFRIILHDLAELYAAPDAPLPPIGYSFPRYLARRRPERERDREAAREYWSARLPTLPAAPRLPLSVAPELLSRQRVTRRHHRLSGQQAAVLAERARRYGIRPAMVFAAAFAEVLATWSEEPDFLLNVPLFDREPVHPDVAALVGDFTNLLIVAVRTAAARSFVDLARQLQAQLLADAAHADFSGLDVLRELARVQGGERALAPVVFTSALGMGELFGEKVRRCFGEPGWSISQAPQVWLDHQVVEQAGGLLLNWDAVDGLFAAGVLDAMFAGYLRLLDWLLRDEADWARPAPSLAPPAQLASRAALNDTARPQRHQHLHRPFFDLAAARPDRPAVVWGEDAGYGYGELARRARRVAGLLARHGLAAGDPVAVTLPKGPAQIAAVLGVLWAGGAFVPIAVDQPAARRAAIHANAGVRLVLTDAAHRARVAWPPGAVALAVEDADGVPEAAQEVAVDPDGLAYVMYTSGSTGEPKGVEVSHRAATNTIEDLTERFGIGPADRLAAVSGLDHDLAVFDIFAALSVGGSLAMPDDASRRDAHRWAGMVRRLRVTVWQSVPGLLDMLLIAGETDGLGDSLRLALLGGDWVGLDLHARLTAQVPGCRLVALGGTTEAAIHSTWHEVTDVPAHWRSVPYGRPLRNQKVRVVDSRGRDRPDWVAGELWIGGAGVAQGYRGDPGRTADRFVVHDGERWYRTGDLVRYLPDQTLELLGRTDFQVKILGHRIDLGEVEAALCRFPGVRRAVAVAVGGDRPRLAAAMLAGGDPPDAERVRAFLAGRLPEYMVPHQILVLDELPLTGNGKVDTGAIAALAAARVPPPETAPPRGEVETELAAIWAELLDVSQVGRADSFFALGGNSLLATRMVARLRQAGYPDATLSDLFAAPTLREYASTLARGEAVAAAAPLTAGSEADRYQPFPTTDVQRAYWLGRRADFTLGGVGSHWYWEFDGADVDVERLERAWNLVVRRHDMLRAVIGEDGQQRVLREVPWVTIPVTDAGSAAVETLRAQRDELSHRCYEPSRWPLFEIRAVRYGDGRTRIGFSLDFVVLDALSIMVVFADLAELYRDPGARLAPLAISFRDCVLAASTDPEGLAAARDYWLSRLDSLPPAPALPLAVAPDRLAAPRFVRRQLRVPAEDWQRLDAAARAHGVTLTTVVATVFALVLEQWSESPSCTLNFTLFNRPDVHPDIYRLAGDFTALLLVANEPEAGESFAEAARRLQRQLWADLEHSAYSGVAVLRELARRTGSTEVSMPVVFTSTLGVNEATGRRFDLAMPFGEYRWGLSQTPQVWLDHQVTEDRGGALLTWDVVAELFPDGVLDAMLAAYQRLLTEVATADWSAPIRPALPPRQAEVRRAVNATDAPTSGRLLHDAFFDQAARHPDRAALLWGDGGGLSYRELAAWAGRIAGLLAAHGVRPGDAVAVTLPKGPGQVAAVLGVLARGACYVPVGVDQPAARRDRIYRDAGVACVLTDERSTAGAPLPPGLVAVLLDGAERAPEVPPVAVDDTTPAYVIYTSGSTGAPKGVEVAHRSAVNTVEDVNERFGVDHRDRVLAVSSLDFDLSVYDIFGPLAAGGAVVLVDERERRDAARWRALAVRHGVTIWNSVPALLDMLLVAAEGGEFPPALRLALLSGDWIGLDLPGRLAARAPDCRLAALGGATEAAIWSNVYLVDRVPEHWSSIPYGSPLRNQRYRVVDGYGADRPDWVPGELWIGGTGVALGYRGDPERTAERFVEHDGLRWYRTGDRGRYWPDGTLEFLGRMDHQVKVRGHRIELGEVEAALCGHPDVDRAAVVALGDRVRRLAGAVVLRPGAVAGGTVAGGAELRAYLAGQVPDYMVPDRLVTLPALPLTGNGKVDRRRLAATLAEAAPVERTEPPSGAVEENLAGIWARLLGASVAGRDQSFFAAGGDSLLATRLVGLIRQEMAVEVSLRDVLAAPTIAEQAVLVAAAAGRDGALVEEGTL